VEVLTLQQVLEVLGRATGTVTVTISRAVAQHTPEAPAAAAAVSGDGGDGGRLVRRRGVGALDHKVRNGGVNPLLIVCSVHEHPVSPSFLR
jgi:hypothetical protein